MRKYIALAIALTAVLSGCRSTQEELGSLASRRSSDLNLYALINQDDTRTTLDGLTVRWAEGDSLGLFSSSSRNVAAVLDNSTAGKTEGLFTSMFSGTPQYAYYPYDKNASGTRTSVDLTLPDTQVQAGDAPNMRYDVKAGRYLSGSVLEKFTFEFKEKMAILEFVLTGGAVLEGDVLQSISFADAGKALAGNYTLTMSDFTAALAFADGASSSVTLTIEPAPTLAATGSVTGWMFVNPAVKGGDNIVMTVKTDKHVVTVNAQAAKDYLEGYKYNMPLDISALVASGKATVTEVVPVSDITGLTDYGVYDMISKDYVCKYEAGVCQYATYDSGSQHAYRLQSFSNGYAVEVKAPKSLSVGSEVDVTVTVYGPIAINAGTFKAEVVKVTTDTAWLSDAVNMAGYIVRR